MNPNQTSLSCAEFHKILNAVLDQECSWAAVEAHPHLEHCACCAELVTLAPYLTLTPVPSRATPRVCHYSEAETYRTWIPSRRQGLFVSVVAASLVLCLFGFFFALPWRAGDQTDQPELVLQVEKTAPKLDADANEADTVPLPVPAFALSTSSSSDTISRWTSQLRSPFGSTAEGWHLASLTRDQTQTTSLASVPESAVACLEPLAGTTKRAWTTFARIIPELPNETLPQP